MSSKNEIAASIKCSILFFPFLIIPFKEKFKFKQAFLDINAKYQMLKIINLIKYAKNILYTYTSCESLSTAETNAAFR